jgi:hypothetical protein
MKKFGGLFLGIIFLLSSCNNAVVEKPNNLLDEDKMVDIIYDLALLEALKSQGNVNHESYPTIKEFLKNKYKLDSVTFAKNSKYYASDIKKYKKIYQRVLTRLDRENVKINGAKKEISPEGGIVK